MVYYDRHLGERVTTQRDRAPGGVAGPKKTIGKTTTGKPTAALHAGYAKRAARRAQLDEAAEKALPCDNGEDRSCTCPDFDKRGRYRNPPYCKHILGVAYAKAESPDELYEQLEYRPTFVNESGREGYAVPEGRAWDVKATSTEDESYKVVFGEAAAA